MSETRLLKPAQSKGVADQTEKNSDEVKLPSSRKVYVETNGNTVNHSNQNIRVPFREIALSPSKDFDGNLEENPPVRIYDTSGVWTDPSHKCDVREGLPALRRDWIVGRGDVEEYEGRRGEGETGRKGEGDSFPGLKRPPLRAKAGNCVTQMHYARRGIITPEMEYVAIRENLGRQIAFEQIGRNATVNEHAIRGNIEI